MGSSVPSCPFCLRAYSDPEGCEAVPETRQPVTYGDELYPLSVGNNCIDCAAPMGARHHAGCLCRECPDCRRRYHGSTDCDEDAHAPIPLVRQRLYSVL